MANWPLIFVGSAVGLTVFAGIKQALSATPVRGPAGGPPLPTLKSWGVSLAAPTGRVWPVAGGDRSVSYTTPAGAIVGNSGTVFHASRESGVRYHAGIDLQAAPGQNIVAMENGIVLGNIPGFVGLDAMVVQHASVIAVYAEVRSIGLTAGTRVSSGQRIANGVLNKDGNSMLHLELWRPGFAPKGFVPWLQGKPAPAGLLDPTQYLLQLAKRS